MNNLCLSTASTDSASGATSPRSFASRDNRLPGKFWNTSTSSSESESPHLLTRNLHICPTTVSDDLGELEGECVPVNLDANLYHSTKVCYDYQSATVSLSPFFTSPQEVARKIWKVYDPTHGRFYYYNQKMGQSSWSPLHNPGGAP